MSKMNVVQAAKHFGISKEAIHNRIRRGSLESVIEDGIKYVLVDENTPIITKTQTRRTTTSLDDKYYKLLEEQNKQLQEKVQNLENETRSLRDQKEQMLIEERKMIEQVYKDKDEQFKNILLAFQAQLMIGNKKNLEIDEHLDAEIEEIEEVEDIRKPSRKKTIISLKKYLKQQKVSQKKANKIKMKLKKKIKEDDRIILVGKKIYLDLQKYDYSDLLK